MTLYLPGCHIHRASDTAEAWLRPDGANVWVDIGQIQFGVPYSFRRSGGQPGRLMVLDAGPDKSIVGYGRGVRLDDSGQTVTVTRTSAGVYHVTGPCQTHAGAFTVRSLRVLLIGQSLASAWRYTDAAAAFDARLRELGLDLRPQFLNRATGGSACEKEFDKAPPNRHWFDALANSAGPLLTDARTFVQGLAVKPDIVIWHQGQQDGGCIDPDDAGQRARQKLAIFKVLDLIREAINPADRYSVPAFINFIGRTTNLHNMPGYIAIREIQDDVIATWGAEKNILAGAETVDLDLADSVHLTPEAYAEVGRRNADIYAAWRGIA